MDIVTLEKDFVTWLIEEVERRGWNNSEFARRIGVSPSNVHIFVSRKRNPTWDFCVGVARAFGLPEDDVFRRAGLLPSLPPEVAEEREAVRILRGLPGQARAAAMSMLRGLGGRQGIEMAVAEGRGRYAAGGATARRDPFFEVLEGLWERAPDWKKRDLVTQLRTAVEEYREELEEREGRRTGEKVEGR